MKIFFPSSLISFTIGTAYTATTKAFVLPTQNQHNQNAYADTRNTPYIQNKHTFTHFWYDKYQKISSRISMSIDSLNVESMNDDHEKEGSRMAESIAGWLDSEWIPQEVHKQMGNSAKKSYISCRESGETDIMSIMMQVGNDLESNWESYDKDAFNGAWDVANYVSDYLTKRAGQEGCSCNYEVFEVEGYD